jgi:RimJ/RimL family protein N-acetyltransferase
VTDWLGAALSRRQSHALADRIEAEFREHGFGLWALEVVGVCPFIGFVGLNVPSFDAPFMPAVEAEWRLDAAFWGRGYATEAGHAAVRFAFEVVGLDELVSFTAESNIRSRRVMERLGMIHDVHEDFDHPRVPVDSPLRRHVLYRMRRDAWEDGLPNKAFELTPSSAAIHCDASGRSSTPGR